MKIDKDCVIFVPTLKELEAVFGLSEITIENGLTKTRYNDYEIIVTDIGKTNAAAAAALTFQWGVVTKALLIGICGAYHGKAEVGELLSVKYDYFVDEASLYSKELLTLAERGFSPAKDNRGEFTEIEDLRIVNSNTVSLIPCVDSLMRRYQNKTDATIENMEGASFGAIANRFGVYPYQVRAVSNLCGDVSKQAWNIKLAVKSLREFISRSLS